MDNYGDHTAYPCFQTWHLPYHHQFPFFTGDILWGIEDSEPNRNDEDMGPGDSVNTGLSFQSLDPKHSLVTRVIEQAQGTVEDLDSLVEAGEIPLTTLQTRPNPSQI